MSCAKYGLIPLVLFVAGFTASAQTSTRDHVKRAACLGDIIERVSLTDGVETIGGASIDDAVYLLRDKVAFPVALETIEFDRERPKDFVTLDEALSKLHSMQAAGSLGAKDKARLDVYQELAKTHPGSEVLFARQKTFTLVGDRIAIRELLDQVTTLDDQYEWKNYGTESNPNVVIQPRAESALNWRVPSICSPVLIDQILAGCIGQKCGAFNEGLAARNMYIMYMSMGPGYDSLNQGPHGFVDLCNETLTARDVLNAIAQSAHTSWTLGGIKGLRFISFDK